MVLMIIAMLVVLGLCFGSFVNALVWRLHEQSRGSRRPKTVISSAAEKSRREKTGSLTAVRDDSGDDLSILHGRSMCPHCRHELAATDLVPVFSWLALRGRCRYCRKPISPQYPLVEAATALLFVGSYFLWPVGLLGLQAPIFALWLVLLVGLTALLVYDVRWMLLPDKLLFPLYLAAVPFAVLQVLYAPHLWPAVISEVLAVAVGGGIFYVLYQVSAGKWIGGGDVKLGFLLGLVAGTPARALLWLFLAGILGTVVSLPLLAFRRLGPKSLIPFGPFLIASIVLVQLFGTAILLWYQHTFLLIGR